MGKSWPFFSPNAQCPPGGLPDRQLEAAFEKHLIKSESFRRIQALEGLLKISEEIKVEDFELDIWNEAIGICIDLSELLMNRIEQGVRQFFIFLKNCFPVIFTIFSSFYMFYD